MSDKYNLYAAVAGLVEELRQAGETEWATALHNALRVSNIATEILDELWLQLHKLRRGEAAGRLQLQPRIDEALSYIDKALGPRRFDDECRCDTLRHLAGGAAYGYARMHLREIMMNSQNYHILYECPVTGRYWMKPTAEWGERFYLVQVSAREAAEAFVFT